MFLFSLAIPYISCTNCIHLTTKQTSHDLQHTFCKVTVKFLRGSNFWEVKIAKPKDSAYQITSANNAPLKMLYSTRILVDKVSNYILLAWLLENKFSSKKFFLPYSYN